MKLSQKAKYFTFGIVATAVLLPLAIYAVETIPVTFSEGDVISAGVINNLLKRVNDVQHGFSSSVELLGTYACTSYSPQPACTAGWTASGGGVVSTKTQNITFTCTAGVCKWTAADFFPWNCQGGNNPSMLEQSFEVTGSYLLMSNNGLSEIKKTSPTGFDWNLPTGTGVITKCSKIAVAPAPADALKATVSGTFAALTWTDQSMDETGFKVQRKTSATGAWTDLTTTAANAVTYTDATVTTGTYWYRVLATNANGDSMSSSEVQAVLP